MDAAERARLLGQFGALKQECEAFNEISAIPCDLDCYPSEIVQLLTETANEAKDLKVRILNELISLGPEVDSWRKLIDGMEFTESYRVDKDFRWRRDRPSLKTGAQVLDNICRHFEGKPPAEPDKPHRRRGPEPKMDRHQAIVSVVNSRDHRNPANLRKICEDLDSKRVTIPPSWRETGMRVTWLHALDDDKWRVLKVIEYSLKMVSKAAEP